MRGALLGRYGEAAPTGLNEGDVFMLIDGGKDRKRDFLKHFPIKVGKEADLGVCHTFTMHVSEDSWRQRRTHSHGRAKLTQHIYVVASRKTMKSVLKQHHNFKKHGGSVREILIFTDCVINLNLLR